MSDDADYADEQQQTLLDASIKRIRAATLKIDGNGWCLSCGNEVLPLLVNGKIITGRWCSVECRTAWSAENDS
jgi:hypothetical protein